MVEDVFRSFTLVEVVIAQCKNTQLLVKVLDSKCFLILLLVNYKVLLANVLNVSK